MPGAGAGAGGTENVGEQFESLFVSMMLNEMRQSMSEDGLFAGDSSDVYGGLFDMFLGQHIATQGAFGISDLVKENVPTSISPAATTPADVEAPAEVTGS
jgi:Rod binding domain-containing protein